MLLLSGQGHYFGSALFLACVYGGALCWQCCKASSWVFHDREGVVGVLTVRSSYSRATTTIIRSNEGVVSSIITSRIRRRGLCNNIIPRVTSHHRTRTVIPIMERTLRSTSYELSSVSTVNIACTPKLVKTLLIKIGFTGKLSLTAKVPLIPIRRLHSRVTSGCVSGGRLGPPFLYLIISNNRDRVIVIRSCAGVGVVNGAHSSTTNRTFSGTTEAVKVPCPNKVRVSGITRGNSPFTFGLPHPAIRSTPCSFDFSKLGATMVGLVRGSTRGNIRLGGTSIYTSFHCTIISYLIAGFVGTTRSLKRGGLMVTNNISTGSLLEEALTRRYGGHS